MKLKRTIRKTFTNVIEHDVPKSAAALTYNLLFALFPLLIFISNLLGLLDLNVASITEALLPIMPDDVVYLLESYLNHITNNSSKVLFWFSLVFTVWFPMRAVKGLMDDVRLAYGLGKPAKPVFYTIRQLVFTIVFLVFIVVLFLLAILGRRFVTTVTAWLGVNQVLQIPPILLNLWQYLRFALLAAIMFAVVGLLYAVAQDRKNRVRTIMPGIVLAMAAWLVVSIGFSAYVENVADYSVIYGTLGAVIVLLVWLYLTSFVLILGAEFNAALLGTDEKSLLCVEASEVSFEQYNGGNSMTEKKPSVLFKIIKWFVKVFYPKMQVEGAENLPDEPVVIVGNHCQMNGPVVGELYVPGEPYIWCAGEMMHLKDVPEYAFRDFWSQKPKWTHPGYKLLSYIIAPIAVCVFNNARTIGVYHDTRILSTFKNTVKKLQEGKSVVIFPEHDVKHNHIVYDFQDKFIDIAKLYYKKTGKELKFVPMYIAPKLKKICLGKPVQFCADEPMDTERSRICTYLMDEITAIAEALPEHTVVPYRNIPKKDYPYNRPKEHVYEKAGR